MNAGELMTKDVLTCSPEDSIGRLVERFETYSIGGMPVVNDEGDVVGVISKSDIVDANVQDRARDYMSTPVISVDMSMPVEEVASIFKSKHVNRLPVVRGAKLVGIITRDDLVTYLANIPAWKKNF